MKKVILSVTLLLLILNKSLVAQVETETAKFFKTGKQTFATKLYPGDSSYDVLYYKLDLKLDHLFFHSNYLQGVVTTKAKVLNSNFNSFYLELMNTMTVDSISSPLGHITFNHSNDKINITLPVTLNQGDIFDVTVYYKGVPGSSGLGSFEFASHNGNPIIWSLSEPYGSMDWWPCKDTPADKPDSADIWITANSFFTSVSNGKLTDVIDNGNNTKTYKWKVSYPIATYLISVAMTNYYEFVHDYVALDGSIMKVHHFSFPEYWSEERRQQMEATSDMITEYAKMFGEYPFIKEKYGHAEFMWGGGMEHQTITSIVAFSTILVAHELAHQWFGDMITCKDWQNIWLNEGFATYCEALYTEKKQGYTAYKSYMQNVLSSAKNASGTLYCQNIDDVNSIFNSARSYKKGGSVLHMLRWVLGDSLFFKTMYNYANDPQLKYGVAVTEDFWRVAEETSNMDLDFFFNEWVYGERYPKYTADLEYIDNGSNYKVKMVLTQNNNNNNNPEFFTMPVEVRFKTPSGDTLITVWNNQKVQEYNFVLSGKPSMFVLDPNSWLLKDVITHVTGVTDNEINISDYKLEQNYPNPFNPETKIVYSLGSPDNVKLTIYDVLGKEITTLVNEFQNPGSYTVNFNAANLSGGVYFYELQTDNFRSVRKLVLLQ